MKIKAKVENKVDIEKVKKKTKKAEIETLTHAVRYVVES